MQYLIDIAINLIANLIGWLIVLTIGLYAVYGRSRKRRKLLNFLGLDRNRTAITVYLSSLDLSIVVDNLYDQRQSWEGIALSAAEFEVIPRVDRWLQPIVMGGDNFIDQFLNFITPSRLKLPKISLEYLPAPRKKEELQLVNKTSIIIGGCAHNYGAKVYTDEGRMIMETVDADKAVRVLQGMHAEKLIQPTNYKLGHREQDNEVAKLEKVYDMERGSVVFFAEGVDTNGTLAAVYYLISNWERLAEQHKNQPFAICIECPSRNKDRYGYLTPTVLFELPNITEKAFPKW